MGEYRKKTAARFSGSNPVPRVPAQSVQPVPSALEQAERKLLLLFFRYSGLIDSYKEILQQTGFASPVRQSIYEKICKLGNVDFSTVKESLFAGGDEETNAETARILAGEDYAADEAGLTQIADGYVRRMQREFLQRAYEDHRRLADMYAGMNDPRFEEEIKICNELRGKITNLYGN